MSKNNNIIEKAAKISVIAHSGQTRKDDGSPYIVHPFVVALKLMKYNFPDAVIAAALMHDVLEDTDFSEEEFKKELGEEVLEIVKPLTEDKSLPWEERKKKYVESLRGSREEVKAIAVADKIHNLESLLAVYEAQGNEIWKKFNRGKEQKIWFENEVLKMFKETWKHPLIEEYEYLLDQEKGLK